MAVMTISVMISVTPTIAAINTGLVDPEREREKTETVREIL